MSDNEVIRLDEVSHVYSIGKVRVPALTEISLGIEQGAFIAIAGPSGSGKTTLLHIIGCLLRPSTGSYRINGRKTGQLGNSGLARIRNTTFGFVFQNFNLLPRATALQNVQLPLVYGAVARTKRRERARDLLIQVGLGHRMNHRPNELSGGEQQRVAIARALANRPRILIADEPTGNLDSAASEEILHLFEAQVENDITVIFVSHDPAIIARTPKQIHLKDGRLVGREG